MATGQSMSWRSSVCGRNCAAMAEARRFYERHGFWDVEPESGSRMLCYVTELVEPVEP